MKKLFGLIISTVIAVAVFCLMLITPVLADNGVIIVSQKNVNIGDTVSVMVTYNSNEPLTAVSGTVTFDSNVFKYISGGNACLDNTVTIKENIKNGAKNMAYSITFTAIAAGNNTFGFNMEGEKTNGATSKVSQGALVSVSNNGAPTNPTNPNVPADNNPLAVSIDSKGYKIVNDTASIPELANFTRSITKYNDTDINTLTDINGKYVLFYLKNDETGETNWFVKDESDNFSELKYITFQDKMYIIEEETDALHLPPPNWVASEYEITDTMTAFCYKSTKTTLSDFRIFHCYFDGESAFYRYDTKTGILQIDPEFQLSSISENDGNQKPENLLEHYKSLSEDGRLFVILCNAELLAIIILIIATIVNHRKKKKLKENENEE